MRIFSRLTGGIAATALLLTAAGPAAARDWRWGRPYHHDRGPSAGAVIGVIAGVGLLAAIASSASRREAERRADEARRDDDRYDDRYDYDDRDGARYDNRADASPRYDDTRADRGSQDAAVDACVVAARNEASRNGDYAEVGGVNGVSPLGNGWDVSGRVEQRSSFRATDGWQRNFRCAWQDGRVSAVSLN